MFTFYFHFMLLFSYTGSNRLAQATLEAASRYEMLYHHLQPGKQTYEEKNNLRKRESPKEECFAWGNSSICFIKAVNQWG